MDRGAAYHRNQNVLVPAAAHRMDMERQRAASRTTTMSKRSNAETCRCERDAERARKTGEIFARFGAESSGRRVVRLAGDIQRL